MTDKSWQRRASPLSRQSLGGYVLVIVYASLFPFTGWQDLGIAPFAYLLAPLPPYVTVFDVVVNVLGYFPLGALVVLAVYPRWQGAQAVLIALLGAVCLSGALEALQTYLPSRVASNLDLASNALGALLGAVTVLPCVSALLDRGHLRRLRLVWFERHATVLLVLILLWPPAQMFPQPFLFGGGDLPRALWNRLDLSLQRALLAPLPHLAFWPGRLAAWLVPAAWSACVTALNVVAIALLTTLAVRPDAPRLRLLLCLLLTTLLLKTGATFLQARSGLPFDWFSDGARVGVACGCAAAFLLLWLPRAARAALVAATLGVSLALVNLLPVSPYYDAALAQWQQGRYLHFNGIAHWLTWGWPYAALGWCAFAAESHWIRRRRDAKRLRSL